MWTVSIGSTAGVAQATANQVKSLAEAAAGYWSWYIDDGLAQIDILINIEPLDGTTLAEGGTTYYYKKPYLGLDIYEPTTIIELTTGVDTNGSDPDIEISISSADLLDGSFFLGPLNGGLSYGGTANEYDLFTVLVHEIAHGLGVLTFLDEQNTDRTTFDEFVSDGFNGYSFTGAHAFAIYGSAVPLDDSIAHVSTQVAENLLSPTVSAGEAKYISALDTAILADIGVPVRQPGGGDDILYGYMGDDTIAGLAGNDVLRGLAGRDRLVGNAGDDTLAGQTGDDTLIGDDGADNLLGAAGDDEILGGEGDDTLQGGAGADSLMGGGGRDTASYNDASGSVSVSLFLGRGFGSIAEDDQLSGIENLVGSEFDDTLIGDDATANQIEGRGGADRISGRTGDDTLTGDQGDDTLEGGGGADNLAGWAGRDSLFGDDGADTLQGFGSHDSLYGGDANDDLRGGYGKDLLGGAAGEDILRGFDGNDRLFGGGGRDTLLGNNGADLLVGGGGGDRLKGDGGADTLRGLYGDDTMTGGTGNDILEFGVGDGADRITDFAAGANSDDVIRLYGFGSAFNTFTEIMAVATQQGADVVITFGGGDSITLENVNLAALHAHDFLFG